jgi:hypothetical protein
VQSVDILDTLAGGALEDDEYDEYVPGNGKASAGRGPDRLGSGQQKARATFANQGGNRWETIALSVQLQHSTDYCPMPVTDVFVSSLGLFFAFVYVFCSRFFLSFLACGVSVSLLPIYCSLLAFSDMARV